MSSSGVWIPDDTAPKCMQCGVDFGLLRRRHHCRICGLVICKHCSVTNVLLPGTLVHKRVCHECAQKVARQEHRKPGPPPQVSAMKHIIMSPERPQPAPLQAEEPPMSPYGADGMTPICKHALRTYMLLTYNSPEPGGGTLLVRCLTANGPRHEDSLGHGHVFHRTKCLLRGAREQTYSQFDPHGPEGSNQVRLPPVRHQQYPVQLVVTMTGVLILDAIPGRAGEVLYCANPERVRHVFLVRRSPTSRHSKVIVLLCRGYVLNEAAVATPPTALTPLWAVTCDLPTERKARDVYCAVQRMFQTSLHSALFNLPAETDVHAREDSGSQTDDDGVSISSHTSGSGVTTPVQSPMSPVSLVEQSTTSRMGRLVRSFRRILSHASK